MKARNSKWLRRFLPILLVLALVLTISYIGPDSLLTTADLDPGKYELETVLGKESMILEGPVYFEYAQVVPGRLESGMFKLHFVNPLVEEGPGFGFQIPFSGNEALIGTGKYRVNAGSRDLMNSYESVFGYADMGGSSTALYFSESGTLTIVGCNPGEVEGQIDMKLNDGNGASITVRGDFKAKPLPANIAL
jgi:hypothetical protein